VQNSFEAAREKAANNANAEDAAIWRWFCDLFDDGRVRWCKSAAGWLVSVDHRHLATESSFYEAIRVAKERASAGKRRRREIS
jgi:hypothetical protein